MINPYRVLGVPENADMDTIKKAYRNLSRKYHPDANINNPNKDQAEEKFKEIQAAYQQIVDERERGYSSSYSGGNSRSAYDDFFGGFGGARQENNDPGANYMRAAANYINYGRFKEALNTLANVPTDERTAEWYYYSAIANSRLGYNVVALEHAKRASSMEPGNYRYSQLVATLEGGGSWYNEQGASYGRTFNPGSACCYCLALQACCPGAFCCI